MFGYPLIAIGVIGMIYDMMKGRRPRGRMILSRQKGRLKGSWRGPIWFLLIVFGTIVEIAEFWLRISVLGS